MALLVSGSAASLVGCGNIDTDRFAFFYPPYRFRLTLAVETPEGVRSGSSVIEVKNSISSNSIKGEAVSVELPNGQTLFALLRSSAMGSSDWASEAVSWIPQDLRKDWALADDPNGVYVGENYWKNVATYRGNASVPRTRAMPWGEMDTYPYFVRFKDIQEPSSVEYVDPDDLAASFGPGYRFKSLTAHFTDAPVTSQLTTKLAWLNIHPEPRLERIPTGGTTRPTFAQQISHGDFRRGFRDKPRT